MSEAWRDLGGLVSRPRNDERPLWPDDDEWWPLYKKCESPIERQMCVAFRHDLGHCVPCAQDYSFEIVEGLAKEQPAKWVIAVFGQQRVLAYRVDFMLAYYSAKDDQFRRLAVECDGHEYHRGSAQAIIRDNRRDMDLAKIKCPVFRFTGTQIFRAANKCVQRIANALLVGG